MSASKTIILRVQSASGTNRIQIGLNDSTSKLYEVIVSELGLNSFAFTLHKDRSHREEVTSSKSNTVAHASLHHGDMLYLTPLNGAVLFKDDDLEQGSNIVNSSTVENSSRVSNNSTSAHISPSTSSGSLANEVLEDEVDKELYQMSGTIQRVRDEKLCRHNSKGCCVHCSPLEPWDENYLKEQNIKHMSFHSFLRKMTAGNSANVIALAEPSYTLKTGCKEHPPWPRGICSRCQPGPVTLQRQTYRHVDNVLFHQPNVVERFLQRWRESGHQRLGFLLGQYERHADVPLGIRARVMAIYEPPQQNSKDHIALQPDDRQAMMERLAQRLRLSKVGWIFTDLLPDDLSSGTVKHLRGAHSHFLSAQECITSAHFQNLHPNACRLADGGRFGSKFVTVCVSGDASGGVALEGYQVSQQLAALQRAEALLPTKDAPELFAPRDDRSRFVPDLYYSQKDRYGNDVSVRAKVLPVEFALLDVPVGVASDDLDVPFHDLLRAFVKEPDNAGLNALLDAYAARDVSAVLALQHAEDVLRLTNDHPLASVWTCPHCTFHNAPMTDVCEMCALPRDVPM